MAYAKGHGQLMLGSSRYAGATEVHRTRIHLLFKVVRGLNLPTTMRGLELSIASDASSGPLPGAAGATGSARVFLARGDGWDGWIIASAAFLTEDAKRSLGASSQLTRSIWWDVDSGRVEWLKAIRRSDDGDGPVLMYSHRIKGRAARTIRQFSDGAYTSTDDSLRVIDETLASSRQTQVPDDRPDERDWIVLPIEPGEFAAVWDAANPDQDW